MHRWMRLIRLLVAWLAFVSAAPAWASPSIVDRVVLVASTTTTELRRVPERRVTPAVQTRVALAPKALPPANAHAGETPSRIRPGSATRGPLVLIPEKYLRNCSLLR